MTAQHARLSSLDASFLVAESETAHMHVGWAAVFTPPADGPRPTFEELREHIAQRLSRAPRYRQRLASSPLGIDAPSWVDDPDFDVERHVRRATSDCLAEVTDAVMSMPLSHEHPLWEIAIAEHLDDGNVGVVGKAHHCMVDGIAAVELAGLLLDASPTPPPMPRDDWRPRPTPSPRELALSAARDVASTQWRLLTLPLRVARSPSSALTLARTAARATGALAQSVRPAPPSSLNTPLTQARRVVRLERPLEDLRFVKRIFGTSLNDVVLAACAGGLRQLMIHRGEKPVPLKTMVPVNVRAPGAAGELGNRISFMFVELPCDREHPVGRLELVREQTQQRKEQHVPEGAAALLDAMVFAPRPVQAAVSRAVASPRMFNLVVSNIPGPEARLWMRGCRMEAAFPVVPLSEGHGVSIGITSIADRACFGVYVDPAAVPDADVLVDAMAVDLDRLQDAARQWRAPRARERAVERFNRGLPREPASV
jgi:WS/DGAT/MGAT family acyltransferase